MRSGIAVALLLMLAACGGSEDVSVTARPDRAPVELSAGIDKSTANPGDIITLTITADYQPDIRMEIPELADRFSEFHIVSSGVSAPAQKDGRLVAERWYKLQADMSGSYVIEPIEVVYRFPDGKEDVAKTPKIFIEIESFLANEGEVEDIRDIKPPVPVPPSYRVLLLISAILAGAILLLLVGRKLIERLKRKAEAERLAPRPAHEEALEALDRLLRKGLVEKGRMREFCFEISEIFRRYMQGRFGIPAIDLTTDEIIPRVEENGIIRHDLRPLVREFLVNTDMVKFAKYQPTRDEIAEITESTRTFIDKTMLAPAGGADVIQGGETP